MSEGLHPTLPAGGTASSYLNPGLPQQLRGSHSWSHTTNGLGVSVLLQHMGIPPSPGAKCGCSESCCPLASSHQHLTWWGAVTQEAVRARWGGVCSVHISFMDSPCPRESQHSSRLSFMWQYFLYRNLIFYFFIISCIEDLIFSSCLHTSCKTAIKREKSSWQGSCLFLCLFLFLHRAGKDGWADSAMGKAAVRACFMGGFWRPVTYLALRQLKYAVLVCRCFPLSPSLHTVETIHVVSNKTRISSTISELWLQYK